MSNIEEQVAATPCPRCGSSQLRFTTRLVSRPLGSWSLSGNQPKTSAVEWPYVVCDNTDCDFEQAAKHA